MMGGLRKKLPRTHLVFFVCWLAICGLPIFSGFFSKDAILAGAFATEVYGEHLAWVGKVVGVMLMLAALGTAFYMSRLYFLVFSGDEPRTTDEHIKHHIHESPPIMVVPLVVLAAGAMLVGLLGLPAGLFHHPEYNLLAHHLEPVLGPELEIPHNIEIGFMVASTLLAASASRSPRPSITAATRSRRVGSRPPSPASSSWCRTSSASTSSTTR